MTIWVTRVAPYHASLVERIRESGWSCQHVPLVEIVPSDPTPSSMGVVHNLDYYDHVVFISRTAIDRALSLFEDRWPQWPVQQTWWSMGKDTAALLRSVHPQVKFASPSTTEGLLEQLDLTKISATKWLVVRGKGGRELLKETLTSFGAQVDYLELYERRESALVQSDSENVDTIFVSSTQNLLSLEKHKTIFARRQNITLIVPSARAKTLAKELGFTRVVLAAGADDDAMMTAWKNIRNTGNESRQR